METYLSSHLEGEPEATIARVEAAARAAAAAGDPVHHVRSIYIPEDEACFSLIEAPSVAAVERLLTRAAVTSIRVASAVTVDGGPATPRRGANPVPRVRGRC